jgi:NAD(P)-dependent dehydrogenase (short-subunit alcohol dehydrogenase family)
MATGDPAAVRPGVPLRPDLPARHRAAVVTGAGRGLGFEIARELLARGWRVRLTDVDGAAAATAAAELGAPDPGTALDVRDADACHRAAREADAAAGGLRLWVNNAGVLPVGPAWESTPEQRRAAVDVNLHGVMNGTVAALDVMRPRGRGHVVTVVSLAGLVAPPGQAVYAATKHAALAFSVGAAADLRVAGHRGVHVSTVCPDGLRTPMLDERRADPHAAASWSGSLLDPAAIARVVADVARRPRPVTSVPIARGVLVRVAGTLPALHLALAPWYQRRARRRQAADAADLAHRTRLTTGRS